MRRVAGSAIQTRGHWQPHIPWCPPAGPAATVLYSAPWVPGSPPPADAAERRGRPWTAPPRGSVGATALAAARGAAAATQGQRPAAPHGRAWGVCSTAVTRRLRLVGGLMRHPGAPWRPAHLLSSARSGPRAAATVVGGERRAAEAAARAEPRPGAADITRQWRDAHRSMCEAADGPSSARAGCSAVVGERHGACVVAAVLASATRDGWTGWRDREASCRVDDDEKESIISANVAPLRSA